MDRFGRRDLIKVGALGAAVAGLDGRFARPAAAAVAAPGTKGIHIHGTLDVLSDLPGDPPTDTQAPARQLPPLFRFNISIEVWGPDANLSGQGWGAMPDPADPKQPTRVDALQRVYTQQGSIDGDIVRLRGRMLFSYIPGDAGGPIVTEANLVTGAIRFYAGNTVSHASLAGTGVVMRI
jgi:hypothetical protein